jgi:hypothetical protein
MNTCQVSWGTASLAPPDSLESRVQVGLAVDVRGPALRGLFHGQVRAADRRQPIHGADDIWQVRRARTIVRVPGTIDVLEGKQIPSSCPIGPEQPRATARTCGLIIASRPCRPAPG